MNKQEEKRPVPEEPSRVFLVPHDDSNPMGFETTEIHKPGGLCRMLSEAQGVHPRAHLLTTPSFHRERRPCNANCFVRRHLGGK